MPVKGMLVCVTLPAFVGLVLGFLLGGMVESFRNFRSLTGIVLTVLTFLTVVTVGAFADLGLRVACVVVLGGMLGMFYRGAAS